MIEAFQKYLTGYQIKKAYLPILFDELLDMIEGNKERQAELSTALKDVQGKIDTVEEKYFVIGGMSKETYEKLLSKFAKEKEQIMDAYKNCSTTSSNLDVVVESAVTYSLKLATE